MLRMEDCNALQSNLLGHESAKALAGPELQQGSDVLRGLAARTGASYGGGFCSDSKGT
jgi:hypothetical protein